MRHLIVGLTVVELLIVVALVAILAGVGATQFNFGGVATRQAAQTLSSAVNRARIEAIRSNGTAGLVIEAAGTSSTSGVLRVCRDVDVAGGLACPADLGDPDYVYVLDFADGDLGRAQLIDSGAIFFDRRGVMRNPAETTIRIRDRAGGNERTVVIAATGRAVIQ